jgi:apolipoprotein N-acyltransferase
MRYNVYNSALGITGQEAGLDIEPQVYHKSKLVVGVEMFPYPKVLGLLRFLNLDLGGMSGSLGMQADRTVFTSPQGVKTGVAICYESVYGEYFTEYIRAGAGFMSIITNDGWWGDTPGHRQHFALARLRAVETRRSIARSANTGISGFIDQRGDIAYPLLNWDERWVLVHEINLNDELTFYVRHGDYIVRISLLLLGLSLLYYLAWKYRRRSLL